MRIVNSFRRKIAVGLLTIWIVEIFQPSVSLALTNGPGQPETTAFQQASTTDMVDVSTGDFKYNIPLMDVDGYPVNLSYQSGISMDDEASWVGLGWNLNVGAINRQLRGVPDDFSGDTLTVEHDVKPKTTVGGRVSVKSELFGAYRDKLPLGKVKISGELSLGVFSDSYTGIGAEVGVNPGISFGLSNDGDLTAGLGLGILSNTQSGVEFSPKLSMAISDKCTNKQLGSAGLSMGYNSRSGMKSLTFSASYSPNTIYSENKKVGYSGSINASSSLISFNTEPVMPSIQVPYRSTYGSLSLDAGVSFQAFYIGGGVVGYQSKRVVKDRENVSRLFGYLYSERANNVSDAVLDFIREKDNPVTPELPNLAVPINTPDLFTYSGQAGSGQFKLSRGYTGIFGDKEVTDETENLSFGGDIGFPNLHIGTSFYEQNATTKSKRWKEDNNYWNLGKFASQQSADGVYFKVVGEKNFSDNPLSGVSGISDRDPIAVFLNKNGALSKAFASASFYKTGGGGSATPTSLNFSRKQPKNTVVSYLTADEAGKGGLEKDIVSYKLNTPSTFSTTNVVDATIKRSKGMRKAHHISQIDVLNSSGSRMVYGLPVYNIKQEEYSFALGTEGTSRDYTLEKRDDDNVALNQVKLDGKRLDSDNNIKHEYGFDHYFHKETQSSYATSFLLTGVLSPDYVDKTGNGITDDDLGTAVKFNYSKTADYRWRSPYGKVATVNKGLLADPDDDKASIVYGEKELWYLHSIESKTQVAYFITDEREDGYGVKNWMGEVDDTNKQRCLKEIRLYSKADKSKPIKVVKFSYKSSGFLCPKTPNSKNKQGKLTLEKVWFEYGNSTKGSSQPYEFEYKNDVDGAVINYSPLSTDRWGIYKPLKASGWRNDEFPYTDQNPDHKELLDESVALWHLNKITLPSGGIIKVTYESDDYAYVQNKKAMAMVGFNRLVNLTKSNKTADNLLDADGVSVTLSKTPSGNLTDWFKKEYLDGQEYLFAKFFVKMDHENSDDGDNLYDFVSAYCRVKEVVEGEDDNEYFVVFDKITEGGKTVNPVALAGWQKLKNDYPRYAYPGYQERATGGNSKSDFARAIKAIATSVTNLGELFENFYEKADRKGFAKEIKEEKSLIRLCVDSKKIGGGVRVKNIQMNDDWQNMSGSTASNSYYGQAYYYETEEGKSSGVASYEPTVGSDENALRLPILYTQSKKGGLSDHFSIEEPFGEGLFPSPSVVYSRVVVKDISGVNNSPDAKLRTGYVVNEFYTARDFPVNVSYTTIEPIERNSNPVVSLVTADSFHELTLSQGYYIELNDMHGKPKAVKVHNSSGTNISSVEYHYNSEVINSGTGESRLKNVVDIVKENGTVSKSVIVGRDVDFYTDFREQEFLNTGISIQLGLDLVGPPVIKFPWFHFPNYVNTDYKLFRSACAVKVAHYYGIIDKIVKTENGASLATENIAYDEITGESIVTRVEDDKGGHTYSVNLPAYWVYSGMGGAYKNVGTLLSDVTKETLPLGEVSSAYNNVLTPGDEILDLATGNLYWVINAYYADQKELRDDYDDAYKATGNVNTDASYTSGQYSKLLLVDRYGERCKKPIALAKVLRSGNRNLLSENAESIVCLENPIQEYTNLFLPVNNVNLGETLQAIQASAKEFRNFWPVEDVSDNIKGWHRKSSQPYGTRFFEYVAGWPHEDHGKDGVFVMYGFGNPQLVGAYYSTYTAGGRYSNQNLGDFIKNRLDQVGIWPKMNDIPDYLDKWCGFETTITLPANKQYYIGYSGDDEFEISMYNMVLPKEEHNDYFYGPMIPSRFWNLRQLNVVSEYSGMVTYPLKVKVKNVTHSDGPNTFERNPGTIGIEIYEGVEHPLGADYSILHADANGRFPNSPYIWAKKVWSTRDLLNDENLQSFYITPEGKTIYHLREKYYINPYTEGILGNWRLSKSQAYLSDREGSSFSKNGIFKSFYPYYWYGNFDISTDKPKNVKKVNRFGNSGQPQNWVASNTVTLYSKNGQELENVDVLGQYSAAKFSFSGTLPASVASNAMYREIYNSSFEDINSTYANRSQKAKQAEFLPVDGSDLRLAMVSGRAHTGIWSAKLPSSGLQLAMPSNTSKPNYSTNYMIFNEDYEYKLLENSGLFPMGFQPETSKFYLLSFWVYSPGSNIYSLLKVYNNNSLIYPEVKANVDGWHLLQLKFNPNTKLVLKPMDSETYVLVDDIRIHPFNSEMKSYVYNPGSYKLMAELDANNFATIYEYDESGALVRVKKETERGIVTLKESRSSYKHR